MNRFTNFLADHGLTTSILCVAAAATLATCAPAPALAKCRANDAWRGPDKVVHAQVGALVGLAGSLNNGSWLEGVAWAAVAGAGKEIYDATGAGDCSFQDLAATVVGGALGAGLGKGLYLTFDPRARSVQVTYTVELK